MDYQHATWRILLAKGTYVEVSIKGLASAQDSCPAGDVITAGVVLQDVGRAMLAISEKWGSTQKHSEPSSSE